MQAAQWIRDLELMRMSVFLHDVLQCRYHVNSLQGLGYTHTFPSTGINLVLFIGYIN